MFLFNNNINNNNNKKTHEKTETQEVLPSFLSIFILDKLLYSESIKIN